MSHLWNLCLASQAYNAGVCKSSHADVRSKPARRSCNTGSIIMIHSVASESPKGLLQCHNNLSHSLAYFVIFVRNRTWRSLQLLVAGIRVNEGGITVLEQCCECQVSSYQNCEKQQNMENGANVAVPWEVQQPKSFQVQGGRWGLRPRPPYTLAIGPPGIPCFPQMLGF